MAKEQAIEQFGEVIEDCSRGFFSVQLQNSEHIVHCTLSGKMRTNYVRVLVGDKVKLELTPYDLTKGRIVLRLKSDSQIKQANTGLSTNKKNTFKPKKRK